MTNVIKLSSTQESPRYLLRYLPFEKVKRALFQKYIETSLGDIIYLWERVKSDFGWGRKTQNLYIMEWDPIEG